MSTTVHSSHCKSALASADRWFSTQGRSAKPATHTFLCGGIAVLQNDEQFVELYAGVARDVLENEGRVSICENFPRITGSWPSRYFPPPHLIRRAVKMLRFSEDTIPAYLLDSERNQEDKRINPSSVLDVWMLCAFAMDFDFKEIPSSIDGKDGWLLDDIIADVRVVQRAILECGRNYRTKSQTDVATCVICVAYNNQKLGVHLYFPFTRYYPEECMHLAAICISRLQEERTVMAGCTRSWHEIVDLIYNGSLRMPFVQKAKRCSGCENNPRQRRHCTTCQQRGIVWDDRRYYPVGMIDGNGEWMSKENSWIDPMVDFIRREPGISQKFRADHICNPPPLRCETTAATARAEAALEEGLVSSANNGLAREAQMAEMVERMLGRQKRRPSVDKHKCAEYIVMFFCICSLRINAKEGHTSFIPSKMMPRPNYPRSWVHYFESVIHALQPPPTLGLSLTELNARVNAQLNDTMKLSVVAAGPGNDKSKNSSPSSSSASSSSSSTTAFRRLQINADRLTPIEPRAVWLSSDEKGPSGAGATAAGAVSAHEQQQPLDGVEAEIADIVRRLQVLKLQPMPWSNPGGSLGTDNHTVSKERESWEDRSMRSKFSHLFLTRMDDLDVVRKMATGIFSEFREVETIANDPEGRCKRLQAHIRQVGAPFYSKIQVIKIHISLKFKNSLVQVDGPGRHYCQIAGRNHRHNIITFQVRRQGQVLLQNCFHPKCAGRHHNMGAIQHFDIRVLFAPGEVLKECEKKAPAETVALAKNLQKTSLAHSTAVQKRTRRKTTVEHITAALPEHDAMLDELPSKFGPNAPLPLAILTPTNRLKLREPLLTKEVPLLPVVAAASAAAPVSIVAVEENELEPPESPCQWEDLSGESEEENEKDEAKTTGSTGPPQKPFLMRFDEAISVSHDEEPSIGKKRSEPSQPKEGRKKKSDTDVFPPKKPRRSSKTTSVAATTATTTIADPTVVVPTAPVVVSNPE